MNINISIEMIRVVRRVLERDIITQDGNIEEGDSEVYPVDREDALELFKGLERAARSEDQGINFLAD